MFQFLNAYFYLLTFLEEPEEHPFHFEKYKEKIDCQCSHQRFTAMKLTYFKILALFYPLAVLGQLSPEPEAGFLAGQLRLV